MENNDENSGSLTSLPVDRLMACSTATPPLVPIKYNTGLYRTMQNYRGLYRRIKDNKRQYNNVRQYTRL